MIRFHGVLITCFVVVLSIGLAPSQMVAAESSSAEKLLTRLPDDVLGFATTSGGDALKPAFEKTIMGRIWYDPGVQSFFGQIQKEILSKIARETPDPNAVKMIDLMHNNIRLALSRPIIAGAAQKPAADGPPIYGFVILDAGPRKADIATAITDLESLAGDEIIEIPVGSAKMHGPKDSGGVPVYWGWAGNYLVIAVNDGAGLAMQHLSAPRNAPVAQFNKVPDTGDALAVHIDCQKIAGVVSTLAQQRGHEEQVGIATAVIKQLGLNNVKTLTARMGFAGPDVVSSSFLEMPQPRTGLLANYRTANLAMFDMVDAGAVNAATANCNVAGIYDTIMGAVKSAAGDEFAEIEKVIADAEAEMKIKIRGGLLQSLSGEMVGYALPGGSMQSLTGGFVLIAKLKDARLLEETLTALGKLAAEKSDGMVQVSSQVQNGRTVHTWGVMALAMAQMMPTWTVVGDKLVVASNPQFCSQAVDQISTGTKSIRSTPGFMKATANLPDNLVSLRYSDSKVQFNQMMTVMQQFWPMATMAAAKAEMKLPFVLPNLSYIAADMGPSCQYARFDDQGFYGHYRGAGIEASMGAVAGAAMGVGIMMPALARTRQVAFRMVSASNLSAIGKASLIYSNDYDDQLPPNLQVLVEKAALPAEMLESKRKPKGFDGPSYIYVAGQNTSMYPGNIVAYENPRYCSDGLNVLFLDSHVEWMKPEQFLEELEATYKHLGKEMPEIEFRGR